MKYTKQITVEWKCKNPFQQSVLMGGIKNKFDKWKKKGHNFIYTIVPSDDKLSVIIMCDDKFAKDQKETFMAKRLGISLKIEDIK